ncbi:MAG: imelysin family protein [Flavicella sp.]
MIRNYFYLVLITLFLTACKNTEGNGIATDTYNRTEVLKNLTDNIIIPSYASFRESLSTFKLVTDTYVSESSEENLTAVKNQWLVSYKLWQHVEMFDIGKAEEIRYNLRMNSYATKVSRIESNVNTFNYDLSEDTETSFLSQGFPAIDYLLFGLEDNVLEGTSDNYRLYLAALVDEMISNTDKCIADWNNNRDAFINDNSNTKTSSFNKLANDFVYYYEKGLRTNKIGIPVGYWDSNIVASEMIEGYYKKDISKILLQESLTAVENFFLGKKFGGQEIGESFKSYLEYLDEETELTSEIANNFEASKQQIEKLQPNFVNQLETDYGVLELSSVFDAIHNNVPKFKIYMLAAFQVSTDYADADGD